MKEQHLNEIKAIIISALGLILLLSFISYVPEDLSWYTSNPNIPAHNFVRIVGAYIAGASFFIFGYSAYFFVVFLFFWAWVKFSSRNLNFSATKLIASLVFVCVLSALISLTGNQHSVNRFDRAGMIGLMIADFLSKYLGVGVYVILFMLGTLSFIVTGEFLISPIVMSIRDRIQQALKLKKEDGEDKKTKTKPAFAPLATLKPKINIGGVAVETEKGKLAAILKGDKKEPDLKEPIAVKDVDKSNVKDIKPVKPTIKIASVKTEEEPLKEDKPITVGNYALPSLDLLDDAPQISTDKIQSSLMSGAKLLEETLTSFGVVARVVDIERGPAITRYELEPAPGVKVQKFTTLSDDIALAMSAHSIRVVAPIPGKNRVGIEVPNGASSAVYLKDILSSTKFRNSAAKSKLTMALGKDIGGEPMVADLAEMPHLMIAGTTGSGKSVCVNGIIMSFLLNATPDEVRFVMVDPKMVELSQFNDIPHLLAPTVTDPKKAAGVLNWVVGEMENRYKKLSAIGVKNIKGYNAKGNTMPYIVVIIDELADLMQVSAKTVESSITRLAQLSRAVGIHLILATQRPSVDVITGVIKANFPARISFKVASKVDSRTVLDLNGAESLLGKGDMLFIQPGDAKPTRGQGNYVKDEEIARVLSFIKGQQEPVYDESVLKQQTSSSTGGSEEKDELFDEAVRLVIETNQASVSILQRRMRLGYTRAARLIDMMEQAGLVGPYVGSKPRDILVDREQWLLENMQGKTADEKQS
jgi:S-DNA-T family DNA segregation ATPase FtsK/SpoIIIE